MSKTPKTPGNLSHLQRLANLAAGEANMPVGRYQRWVNVQIISAVLERVRDREDKPLFILKGGAAMELRLGITARASKDYDAAFRDQAGGLVAALDQALAEEWNGFQLERTEIESIHGTGAVKTRIRISYKGRVWGSVKLEASPAEGPAGREIDRVPARSMDALQIDGPDRIACLSVRYQIAQKIHACTEVPEGDRPNDRFRDLIDIQMLRELVPSSGLASLRTACVEIFELRRMHAWPPDVVIWPAWPDGFARMAREIGFQPDDVVDAAQAVRRIVAETDRSG